MFFLNRFKKVDLPKREQISVAELTVDLVRSKRKTVGIYVKLTRVEVRVPETMPTEQALSFIDGKLNWIRSKTSRQANLPSPIVLTDKVPEMLPLFGVSVPVKQLKGRNKMRASSDAVSIVINGEVSAETLRCIIVKGYRQCLWDYLNVRLPELSQITGLSPSQFLVRDFKRRWGSCDNKGLLKFNWRLSMAPKDVVDYVVVHELCHLSHLNHSKSFWALVSEHCPDHKKHESWLALNGTSLDITLRG